MIRQTAISLFVLSVTLIGVAACSGGEIAVGKSNTTDQALQTKKDGSATGNGSSCSWDGTVAYDVATGTTTTTPGSSFSIGDNFKSLDGCNDCQCAAQGIMCTMRACAPGSSGGSSPGNPGDPVGCSMEAKICPDGSAVGRSGPKCEFTPCPGNGGGGQGCTEEAKQCPDGTSVGRTGPNCEFAPCPAQACPADAMLCPDGKTSVGRTGPNCEFAPCP